MKKSEIPNPKSAIDLLHCSNTPISICLRFQFLSTEGRFDLISATKIPMICCILYPTYYINHKCK